MKILFFDMEFANGKVPGSIYSLGYMMTDESFEILVPQTDLLINPDSTWNEYVAANILAYPMETVEAAPKFPALYGELRELFDEAECREADAHIRQVLGGARRGGEAAPRMLREIPRDEEATEADFQ